MTLAAGLYKSQDQQEQDLQDGPGWTIDDQKPGFFAGLGVAPVLRGIGQGAAAGISMLAHGSAAVGVGAREAALDEAGLTAEPPKPDEDRATETERRARAFSKTLIPDPRITGTAANLLQGFSKAATEFTAGSLAGGPLAGATLLGASEGYGHYQDLRDAGVDEATATQSGLLEAMTSSASALLPMGMPAKWLAGLSKPVTLLAQMGAGSAINTSFGAASRYASAKILADAGYPEQAEQQQPWDATNLLTDAITGMFFGAHAGWHGLKNVDPAHVDPSLRDAAKVVQDRQEVAERAPGVPVDMASAAVHRQALETALGDLMAGKPVDLSDVKTEGATFARPEIDESAATKIIRDAFAKSGVLDDAAQFDRWLTGDQEIEATTPAKQERAPSAPVVSPTEGIPKGEGEAARAPDDYVLSRAAGKSTFPLVIDRQLMMRNRLENPKELNQEGLSGEYNNALSQAWDKEARDSFDAQGNFTGKPYQVTTSRGVYHFDTPEAARDFAETHGMKAGKRRTLQDVAPKKTEAEQEETPRVSPGALADRPDLQIVNEHGETLHAGDEQRRALEEEAQANKEAEPMHQSAVECESRFA